MTNSLITRGVGSVFPAASCPWSLAVETAGKARRAGAAAHFLMRMCISRVVPAITLLLALSVCAAASPPCEPAARVGPNAAAADLVRRRYWPRLRARARRAASCCASDKEGSRLRRLPIGVPARYAGAGDGSLWRRSSGKRQPTNHWPSIGGSQRQASTPAGQLVLAAWCRDHGLLAESRIHWTQVLMLQPQNKEALRGWGAQWHQGQLLTDGQVQQEKPAQSKQGRAAMSKKERKWMDHWVTSVANWRRGLRPGDTSTLASLRREVIDAKDPLAIHTLGTVIIVGSRQKSDPKGYRLVSLALIDWLDYCGEPWAVAQLARHRRRASHDRSPQRGRRCLEEASQDILRSLPAIACAGPH